MDIEQAITYPYRRENWKNTLLFPGLYTIAIGFVIGIFVLIFAFTIPKMGAQLSPVLIVVFMLMYLVAIIVMLPVLGYHWVLIGNWQENGLDAAAPEWKGNIKTYFITGIHYLVCSIILIIPIMLSMLTLGLLMPFAMSPIYMAAKERTIGSFFANMGSGFERATSKYLPVLGTLYLCFGIILVAIIPYYILSLTIVGGLVFMMGLNISFMHLLTQAFMTDEEKQVALPAQVSPSMPSPPNYWNKN